MAEAPRDGTVVLAWPVVGPGTPVHVWWQARLSPGLEPIAARWYQVDASGFEATDGYFRGWLGLH